MNGQEIVVDVLRSKLEEQPWYRRVANTVTTASGTLVGVLWLAVSAGVELPTEIIVGGLVLTQIATTVGVKLTPNGVTQRQVAELEDYVGKHRS
ncbi:hypothetical protein [Rhodococcus sp. LW-XY12]|uniref:hypothetical protein n=1 Tax=Rhodococcus sp. LW-XY12 TaxID=2856851 RepID=UPI001C574EB9|nr:hypothetical protein [Rhodococcus sp. LW-XY12]QXU55197.1 hypothetical protein KXC42_08230 [Rhodococcus sp. LW-XY12]